MCAKPRHEAEVYWKDNKTAAKAADFWEDTLRYLYLPRLKDRGVIAQAIVKGAGTRDFFGTAYGEHDGKFDGFKLGDANVQFDDTLLLIEPEAAARYALSITPPVLPPGVTVKPINDGTTATHSEPGIAATGQLPGLGIPGGAPKFRSFHGNVSVNAATAKLRLVAIADEIIATLAADPNAEINVTVEIQADFPSGAKDQTKRAVSENARTLGFRNADWE